MTDPDLDAAIAITRFGLGARPGEIAAARGDPRGFLKAQIRREGADQPEGDGATAQQRIVAFRDYQMARQQARKAGEDPKTADANDPVKLAQKLIREQTGGDFLARARLGAQTDAGFRERWTLFWANHFTVSATKLQTATLVGPFEQEAIRPHVFGRFADLLGAAETHPAMLLYLDQATSIGPDSPAATYFKRGPQRGVGFGPPRPPAGMPKGLNENLAREILELHTVGVNGGYAQADVTEFARAMTGLSIGGPREDAAYTGLPVFRDQAHEPGARTVLGVRYPAGGKEQAGAILADLAARPQTARFVCTKIARHFVADDPPPALVDRLQARWMATGGDLAQVAEALVTSPEAWQATQAKFKTPYEFLVSGYRAAGAAPTDIGVLAPILNALGQKPFSAPSPKGWPEEAEAWAAPDAIVKRMTWAQRFTAKATAGRDPKALAADALGARLRPATALAVARAESRPEGFALLLMSPEFQRR
ncbi:DUF1800 domain-containing protein [Phenylobacterium aquaticum]|uniref:DUF1800 domain-containing protein n=1 Tax=Phenylobacterium aquaticum TaxID=1763816 RepID=UPI001F5C1024|nr:DUF1800 family protein [Phenylobacterium aquaticum]MCI3131391.1 DUF1800 family protein [Phenylobacterium aquaticum]